MIGFRGDDYVVANRNDKTKYVQSGGILKSHEDVMVCSVNKSIEPRDSALIGRSLIVVLSPRLTESGWSRTYFLLRRYHTA